MCTFASFLNAIGMCLKHHKTHKLSTIDWRLVTYIAPKAPELCTELKIED